MITRYGRIQSVICALIVLSAPGTAHAYLDPGTGGVLLQVILGGFAAVGVLLKMYWHRIRNAFGRNEPTSPD